MPKTRTFFRGKAYIVSTKMLMIECQRLDPAYVGGAVSDEALRQRILR
jgi:hypothetical protein